MICLRLTKIFNHKELTEQEEPGSLTEKIIRAAIEIHRALGPGLLESVYEARLIYELRLKKLKTDGTILTWEIKENPWQEFQIEIYRS